MNALSPPPFHRYAAFVVRHPPLHHAFIGLLLGIGLALLLGGLTSPGVSDPLRPGEEIPPLATEFLAAGLLLGPLCGAVTGAVAPLLARRFPERLGTAWTAGRLMLRGEVGDDPEIAARVMQLAYRTAHARASFLLERPFVHLSLAFWGLGAAGFGYYAFLAHAGGDAESTLFFALLTSLPLCMAAMTPIAAYNRFQARRILAGAE